MFELVRFNVGMSTDIGNVGGFTRKFAKEL